MWFFYTTNTNKLEMTIETYQAYNFPFEMRKEIVEFFTNNLDSHENDDEAVKKSLNYIPDRGGHLILAIENSEILGACVINHTHMDSYQPENFLVYLATHKDHRLKGIGKKVMDAAIDVTHGDIYLHIDSENPARKLYEKFGFETPFVEMRYKK